MRSRYDRLHSGTAEAIHGQGRNFLPHTGSQRDVPGSINSIGRCLQRVADDRVIDFGRVPFSPAQYFLRCSRSQLNRRKVGFNAPILDYLDVKDPAVRGYLLDESPVFEHVEKKRIADLLDEDFLPNSQSKFLFYFLNTKMFIEEFGP